MESALRLLHGAPALGASVVDGGVAFALATPNAQAVELCVFDAEGQTEVRRLQMPPAVDGVWQALLPGAASARASAMLVSMGRRMAGSIVAFKARSHRVMDSA
jgi:pullulanase/glycogen debranching enzyme